MAKQNMQVTLLWDEQSNIYTILLECYGFGLFGPKKVFPPSVKESLEPVALEELFNKKIFTGKTFVKLTSESFEILHEGGHMLECVAAKLTEGITGDKYWMPILKIYVKQRLVHTLNSSSHFQGMGHMSQGGVIQDGTQMTVIDGETHYFVPAKASESDNEASRMEKESHNLPGITHRTQFPCSCLVNGATPKLPIRDIIMHLNDECRWSREDIADWLDTLHDSGEVDLTFKVEVNE